MRVRPILLASLGLNAVLGAALMWRPPSAEPVARASDGATNAAPAPRPLVKTHVLVRKQFFSWGEIESKDFPTYIANLRDIDCPQPTIRDIIVAEVDQIFSKRRLAEVPSPSREWWRTNPDPVQAEAVREKMKSLEDERIALLNRLLGPGWERGLPDYQVAELDLMGGAFDGMTAEARDAVQRVARENRNREDAYLSERQRKGEPADPKVMAQLESEARQRLGAVLSPTQLEEYLLRYSSTAERMRSELRGFEPTPDEFRAIFRTLDPADQQVQMQYAGDDPASLRKREELQAQTDAVLAQTLGAERFQFYKMTRDPAFNEAREIAEQNGATADAVLPVYEVNRLAQAEAERIRNDGSLSDEDRERALWDVHDQQQKSIQLILAAKGAARKALEAELGLPPMPQP